MGDTTTLPDFSAESGRGAASFAELDEVLWNPISTAAIARSRPQFDERVLDACCGDGASALPTAELVGVGGLVDAVDIAEPLIDLLRERAGERMPQLHPHVADTTTWEPDGYDLVQCVLGIPFFPDVAAGTRHLIERARPGGRVAVTVWARGALDPLPGLLVRALPDDEAAWADLEVLSTPTVEHAETPGGLAHWLGELGLVDVRAEQVQRHVDLTPELAWRLAQGTAPPAIVSGLGDAELEGVRERLLGALAERDVPAADISTLVAVGRRPD